MHSVATDHSCLVSVGNIKIIQKMFGFINNSCM